ncbi:MAG: Macrolide export ATP-binding/permease protein MacB [Chlamydiae bacterium]|nr:Macrolide export ATP-binding/permease protein MacB [Chlamydiota bacterium]
MENDPTLEVCCKGVTKVYGEGPTRVDALRGIDLTLKKGELLMIVGPSGSGKTTLISIIAGILEQEAGECTVLGRDLKEMSNGERTQFRGKEIGFVFQTFNLIPMLTITENVAVPLLLNGEELEPALKKAEELLIKYGLEDKLLRLPTELSGGQLQRVAIARSCIHGPSLIVCDEPTSSLDHETGQNVMKLFRQEVLEKNRALIIVTHDQRIFPFADRIIKLDDGQVVA